VRYRGIFIADGPSDLPLAGHLEALCLDHGAAVAITAVDPGLLRHTDRTVEGRLRFLVETEDRFDVVFVHRDAESQPPSDRRREVDDGVKRAGILVPVVPVVPVRMTEAWLLLDEQQIRNVAGWPSGRVGLDLPTPREAERLADPKQHLANALRAASGTSGRRLKVFQREFDRHRRTLLERLDRSGPINQLDAWQRLRLDVESAVARIESS